MGFGDMRVVTIDSVMCPYPLMFISTFEQRLYDRTKSAQAAQRKLCFVEKDHYIM